MSEDYSNTPLYMQNNSDSEMPPYADTPLPYVEMSSSTSNQRSTSSAWQSASFTPAPPTEEDRLAATYQLGEVLKRYKSEPTALTTEGLPSMPRLSSFSSIARGSAAARLLVPMLFIATLAIWFSTRTPPWPLLMICLLVLAPWLANVFGRLPGDVMTGLQNTEFFLCANGLMIIKWTRVQAIRWEQIQTVRRNITRDLQHYSYTLYLNEGESVTLDRSLAGPDLRELGNIIEREVSKRLLPDAIAAYETGQALNFGSIDVTAQGLVFKDEENEEQSLPWERFVAIDYHNGYLITIKERKAARDVKIVATWQRIEAESMLNICVFLPLTTHIKESLHINVHKSDDTTIYETFQKEDEQGYEMPYSFQEQPAAQEEEWERMRRVHAEILERLQRRHRAALIPDEVVEALHVLDLSSEVSFDEIRHRYRQLVKRHHPDAGGDPETFKLIDAAYKCVITWIESQKQENT
jgi:hypothetical protein